MEIEQVSSQVKRSQEAAGGEQSSQVESAAASPTSSGTAERHNGHAQARSHTTRTAGRG